VISLAPAGRRGVRIPVEFELPGTEAIISRERDRLIIQPVRTGNLLELLASREPLEEAFPDVDEALRLPRDVNLCRCPRWTSCPT
jgi:antitoxin VapB